MANERKNQVVIATAPDGELIAYGPMTRSHGLVLIEEITSREGWKAVMPIFGSALMWPSSFESKTGEVLVPGRAYAIHIAKG